ncbi:mannosyltransferase putative-domain-containing protein [Obelidium mucronatum]|nr:mannosyltransferase putative-domain-containing protein [Obelidium mucronatum]
MTSNTTLDHKNIKNTAPFAFQKMVNESLRGWADLFGEMGYKVKVDGKTHIQGTGPMPFTAPLYNTSITQPTTEWEWINEYEKLTAWRDKKRLDWLTRSDTLRENLTTLEESLTSTTFDAQQLNMNPLVHISSEFLDIDLKLVQLLDFKNGELGKSDEVIFGGSLLANSSDSFDCAPMMKSAYRLFMSLVPKTMIEPSDLSAAFKLQSIYYLFQSYLPAVMSEFENGLQISNNAPNQTEYEAILASHLTIYEVENVRMRLQGHVDKVVYPWAFNSRYTDMNHLVSTFGRQRGIVMTVTDFGFSNVMALIWHLRANLNCTLPVEIYHNGNADISPQKVAILSSISNVVTLNLQEIFEEQTLPAFYGKPFAILFSSFQEVIYLDDDALPLKNPESEFGHLFFRSREPTEENISTSLVNRFIPYPSLHANRTTRFFNHTTRSEMDATLMMFNKSKPDILHSLLATCHFNLKTTVFAGANRHLKGDRDTYWLAFEMLRIPYKFVSEAGAVGTPARDRSGAFVPNSVCGPPAFADEEGELFFLNRRTPLFRAEFDNLRGGSLLWGTPVTGLSAGASMPEKGGGACLFGANLLAMDKKSMDALRKYEMTLETVKDVRELNIQ